MELSLTLMSKLASMMIMLAVGFIAVRVRLVKSSDSRALSALIVYILIPCTIIRAYQVDLTKEKLQGFLYALLFAVLFHILWIVILRLLRRPLRLTGVERASMIYSNCGNLILPLVAMVFGEEMVFYASPYQLVFNLIVFTHGQALIRSGSSGSSWKKILLHPTIIATAAGLVLMLTGFRLPVIVDTAVQGLAGCVAPASMIVIGMVIGGSQLKKIFRNGRAYLAAAGRLVVLPLTAVLLLLLSGVLKRHASLLPVFEISFLAACAPPAALISQMAVLYGEDAETASTINVIGTVACILTMPLMMLLFEKIFA